DTVVDIDEEYERLIQHLRDSARKAEGSRITKRRLSHETLELIRQRGAARATGNYQLTSELARRCREAVKGDLKKREAAVLAEAAEAGRSIRYTRRDFFNRKTKMTALRCADGTTSSPRKVIEKGYLRLPLGALRQSCPPPSMPPQGGWICHPVDSPFRSPTCHQVGQPCEQAGFRKGFSTIDHIHTVIRLTEVSREYKMPPCPINFTTRISPFYDDIIIDARRGVRQGDTVSPRLFTATLEDVMRRLEQDNMGVRVDGRLLHHLRFADDIILITPNISQAKRMLADFDDACGKIGLQLNLTGTMFMRNGWIPDAPFSLNGTTISECSSYVYPGREVTMMNELAPSWAEGSERLGEPIRASRT
ncbi:hypothetical protein ANCCEY_14676, partial [Ancylostoma ceylanicum]